MSQNPSYFRIGVFVILGTLVLAGAIIFFGAGKYFEKKIILETYFNQSVQGLDVGAPLMFQGVKIGNVSQIGFVFNHYNTDYQYVLVRAEMYPDRRIGKEKHRLFGGDFERKQGIEEMVKKGLRLQLSPQGVTGIALLNAVYLDPRKFPPLEMDWKPHYIYIPSAPGTITQITQTIEKLTEAIEQIDLKEILDDVEELVTTLNTAVQEADISEISRDLRTLLESLDGTVDSLDKILKSKDVKKTIANVTETSDELKDTLKRANRLITNRERSIKSSLQNVEDITEQLKKFMNVLNNYPSWVLFGDPPPHIIEEIEEDIKNEN